MDYLIDLKKQNLSGKVALEGGISLGVDTDGNIKKIDESGAISDIGGSVDESRLLPENPANGDIPCYSDEPPVGVNYNDANTVLLLQGSSNNTAAAATSERLNGVVTGSFPAQADGSILVNGSDNYITCNNADTRRVFGGEFTIEMYIKTAQFTSTGTRQDTNWYKLSGYGNAQVVNISDFYASTAGTYGIWPYGLLSGETFPKNAQNGVYQHLAIDVYMVGSTRKFTMYLNGIAYYTGTYWSSPADWDDSYSAAVKIFGDDSTHLQNASVMSLRVSNIARYKGVSFDPPADGKYLNPPAGYWGKLSKNEIVKTDSNRLLPEGVTDGDIPCFDATATVGGGNDSTTKLLLQPATSNNQIIDQAAGNAAPVTLQNTGVTVDDAGAMVFDGSSYLTLAASVLPAGFLDGTDDWTLDLIYNVSSKSTQCLFGRGTSPRMDFLLQSSGALEIGGGPSLGGNWPFNTDVRLTFELYKDGSSWKYTAFRDGSVVTSGTWSSANWRSVALWIGWDGDTDSRKINGKIKALRLTAGATHKGVAFTPDELPWTQAQVVGEWGKLNKSELVKSVNGQIPDSSGAVTLPEATTSAAGLMAATDKAAIAGLTTHGIYPSASSKSGAVDFNEVIDHGMYFIGGDTPHLNYPETYEQSGGTLQVIRNGNYLTQTFIPFSSNKLFNRSCINALSDSSTRTFTAWRRLLTDADITESKARPGYFKLPGGTIMQWGAATIMNDGLYQVTFPIAFPNAVFIGNATAVSGTASASGVVISISGPQTNRMTLITQNHPGSDQDINVHWLAIGY